MLHTSHFLYLSSIDGYWGRAHNMVAVLITAEKTWVCRHSYTLAVLPVCIHEWCSWKICQLCSKLSGTCIWVSMATIPPFPPRALRLPPSHAHSGQNLLFSFMTAILSEVRKSQPIFIYRHFLVKDVQLFSIHWLAICTFFEKLLFNSSFHFIYCLLVLLSGSLYALGITHHMTS